MTQVFLHPYKGNINDLDQYLKCRTHSND